MRLAPGGPIQLECSEHRSICGVEIDYELITPHVPNTADRPDLYILVQAGVRQLWVEKRGCKCPIGNRGGVERVMGFTSEDEVFRFLRLTPPVEQAMVDSGIVLLKYWLEVGQPEQTRRIESRIDDPRKVWKLSPMDLKSYSRWYDYSRARDEMFAATSTEFAPWHVADSNDKKRARLNIISHLLEQIPYDSPKREPVVLPEREKPGGYREPNHSQLYIPAKY